jgi:hypothetical protein
VRFPAPSAPRAPALLRAGLAAAALLAAACPSGDTGGPHPLTLTLDFDATGLSGCLNCSTVDTCALDCGASVAGLYLVDAETDEVLDQQCLDLPGQPGDTLRVLPQYLAEADALTSGIVVGRRVKLELAVFSPDPFVNDPGIDAGPAGRCVRPVRANATDLPATPGDMHYPSFWGVSDAFALRSGDNPVTVTMSCVNDRPACATRPDAQITTMVTDMKTQLMHVDSPVGLDVRFGHLLKDASGGRSFAVMAELQLQQTLPTVDPVWKVLVPNASTDPDCLATRVVRVDPTLGAPVISCDGVQELGSGATPTQVTTTGYTVADSFVDGLLTQLSLPKIPSTGIILGKVVDPTGGPLAGAVVAPMDGTASVIYLDAAEAPDMTLTASSASGWFVVKEPPQLPTTLSAGGPNESCCQVFTATRGTDVGCSAGPMGTVNGTVMASRIVIDPVHSTCASTEP